MDDTRRSYILREMITIKTSRNDPGAIVSMKFSRFDTIEQATAEMEKIYLAMIAESNRDAEERAAAGKPKVRPKYKTMYRSSRCMGVMNSRTPQKLMLYEYYVLSINEPDNGIFAALNNVILRCI